MKCESYLWDLRDYKKLYMHTFQVKDEFIRKLKSDNHEMEDHKSKFG